MRGQSSDSFKVPLYKKLVFQVRYGGDEVMHRSRIAVWNEFVAFGDEGPYMKGNLSKAIWQERLYMLGLNTATKMPPRCAADPGNKELCKIDACANLVQPETVPRPFVSFIPTRLGGGRAPTPRPLRLPFAMC